MAENKTAAKKSESSKDKQAKEVVQPEQFMNYGDWPLYRPKALFRVKQLDPEKDDHVMISQSGEQTIVTEKELLAEFEPVKGLHKGQDFVQQQKDEEGLTVKDE